MSFSSSNILRNQSIHKQLSNCQFIAKYAEYEGGNESLYYCDSKDTDVLQSGLCIYHEKDYLEGSSFHGTPEPMDAAKREERVREGLMAKINHSKANKETLICIGYFLPNIKIEGDFTKPVYFSFANFQRIDFRSASFSGETNFSSAAFSGRTDFRRTTFSWIDNHPQPGNPNALLIPSMNHSTFGEKMSSRAIFMIYKRYKTDFFPRLLKDPNLPLEDKQKIKELLEKPWNPYIKRHSALTEKSKVLKEHTLRQHAGWSPRSQTHMKYLHYYGNESSESLLEAYGIVTKNQQLSDTLRSKICPNCNESANKPDAKFCTKCRMVLTYDAYTETLEKQQEKNQKLVD